MSSLVQDEVRKLSERVKFGIKRMIKDGKIIGGNLTNYNGNKSTSLIGRDLLTPDEVKNLRYKTIIFPNIGYSNFRDTVIYKKLSCYSAGELKRKITSLEDLSYIYFTAENIETKYDKLYRNRNNKEINKEVYHLEIDNEDNTKSTIEIHLKNPLEKDNSLQKEIIKTGGANE